MKKIIFSAALMLAAAISFAGTPKKEAKDAKAETKAEVKTQEDLTTYYVTGESGSNYTISLTQTKQCTHTGSVPCIFTSPSPSLGSSIPKTTVEGEMNDIEIIDYRQNP